MRAVPIAMAVACAGCDRLFGLLALDPAAADAQAQDAAGTTDALGASDALGDAPADAWLVGLDAPAPLCPLGYASLLPETTMYRFVDTPASWTAAQTDCVNDRGNATNHTHLVVLGPLDQERSAIQAVRPNVRLWIGLTDLDVNNAFLWVTDQFGGPPLGDPAWASGQPDLFNSLGCVMMNGVGDYDDEDCSEARSYVCECDAYPDDPTNY